MIDNDPYRAPEPPTPWIGLLLTALLVLALIHSGSFGCASGRRLDQAEQSLAYLQQLWWEVCVDDPPLMMQAQCDRWHVKIRAQELRMEREYQDRWVAAFDIWRAVQSHAKRLAPAAAGWIAGRAVDILISHVPLLGALLDNSRPLAPLTFGKAASARPAQLEQLRSWDRRASVGQRPRLSVSDGEVLVAWTEHLAAKSWRANLENLRGEVLEQQQFLVPLDARFHQVHELGGQLLVRDGDVLRLGGAELGRGAWETYGGIAGAIVAWQPCSVRPCSSQVLHAGGAAPWAPELFGVDLAQVSTSTVAIASREQPVAGGWTGRVVDRYAAQEGRISEVLPRMTWKPPKDISLEDPQIVEGLEPLTLVGGAAAYRGRNSQGLPIWEPSGRVYLAQAGEELRQVLEVAPTRGNAELGAAAIAGVLHVAAELEPGQVGVWRWEDGAGLQLVDQADGEAPSLAAHGETLWLSTTNGLWRMTP